MSEKKMAYGWGIGIRLDSAAMFGCMRPLLPILSRFLVPPFVRGHLWSRSISVQFCSLYMECNEFPAHTLSGEPECRLQRCHYRRSMHSLKQELHPHVQIYANCYCGWAPLYFPWVLACVMHWKSLCLYICCMREFISSLSSLHH